MNISSWAKALTFVLLLFSYSAVVTGQTQVNDAKSSDHLWLDSDITHNGGYQWKMIKAGDVADPGEKISLSDYPTANWMPAIVPGTVLNSLVYNRKYPEPYYGLNNKIESKLIPDISETGRDFYTYWFRTEFTVPESFKGKHVWLQLDGINYRAEIWVNGNLLSTIKGMFMQDYIDVTSFVEIGKRNGLAIKVYPVDVPGSAKPKSWGAVGEFHNGGNGNIGLNTTMLMTVGWDFTFMDGIRDRNTGIWKNISLYATGKVALRHPFVKSELRKPGYDQARESISVEVVNPTTGFNGINCTVKGEIVGENITFEKKLSVLRGEEKVLSFSPDEFPQLVIDSPRLWWPVNKGPQNLYELRMTVSIDGVVCDSVRTKFGIREITSDTNTPDKSRVFYVNGKRLFIRGTNWIPEAMLRTSDERTYAELRYTRQSGVNLLRMWGGGIAESDYFFQLCDEMGLLVWQEFWMTGDTRHPHDKGNYLDNVASTVKRIRNHPSLAYYVASNESTEVTGTPELLNRLDGTRGYQMQSECAGVHDGSPYKQVNPMQHYENTASPRGSRVDGFNPEYGAPTLPTVEILREMMDEKDLWPINKEVWDYLDGNGFHLMTTMYTDLVNNYGKSSSIDEFAQKGQLLGAINSKSIWEVWNYNKLDYGDRFCSGLLFWYHNCSMRQVSSRMWDWSLEPTASLYHTANSLEPLHAQFDYLKNTVSVVNDYYRSFENYKVIAQVYDINSRKVFEESASVNLPEDGVANDVLTIRFPENISQVHFIKLSLKDEKGKDVSSNFYWRSNDKYEGAKTLTGPASSGFEDLNKLKAAKVKLAYKVRQADNRCFVDIMLRNTSNGIAFFNQLQLLDSKMSPIRPSFYSDNFFSLVPGEKKTVTIETARKNLDKEVVLVLKGWNIETQKYKRGFSTLPSPDIAEEKQTENWMIGPFTRPEGVNPVISPQPTAFYCPMRKEQVKWEESDTFNPAATVKDGKIVVLYRSEDNSAQGIGKRTSRIGYAESTDGVTMTRLEAPVLFPAEDGFESIEWPGGCEDPRVAMTEDGLYVMLYTAWNRKTPRLAVATSKDLKTWTKHGLAFEKAYDGRFSKIASKSASILTRAKGGKLVIDKVNGKYLMYWGEYAVHAATSDNLTDWYPVLDEKNELLKIAKPRKGYFDSQLTECGPPAIRTKQGIVLMYNGKNGKNEGDANYPGGAYCAGQLLLDSKDPYKVLGRLDKPFFMPEAPFEKSGQYKDGTVFIEGLAYYKKKLYLYYGCADSKVAVAVCNDTKDLLKVK